MNFEQQISDFVDAWRVGDQAGIDAVLKSVVEARMDEFLERTSAVTGVGRTQPEALDIGRALESVGLSKDDAEMMSILSAGSFADWVRAQLARREIGAATLADDLQASAPELDDVELDLAVAWLEGIARGDRAASELSEEAVAAISRALDASPETILSLVDRDLQ